MELSFLFNFFASAGIWGFSAIYNFDMYHFPIEDKNENYLIHQILASFDILVQFTWIISDLSLSLRVYFSENVYMVNHGRSTN